MNRLYTVFLLCFIIVSLPGCNKGVFEWQNNPVNVSIIEIVEAKNAFEWNTIKSLSTEETAKIINELSNISFEKYIFGDPMSIEGECIRIVYSDESYDMICPHWSEHIEGDTEYYLWRFCDLNDFSSLINKYS